MKILAYDLDGILSAYNYIGGAMSLINSNVKNYDAWLISNFSYIEWRFFWHNMDFNQHRLSKWEGINCKAYRCFNKKTLLDIIKKGIDSNKYVYLFVNEFYMDYSESYLLNYFPHDMYVIGYDDLENEFTVLAYDITKKMTKRRVPYEDLQIAYMTNLKSYKILHLWIDEKYDFNYIYYERISKNLSNYNKRKSKHVYLPMVKRLRKNAKLKKTIDLTAISIFIEHKYVLTKYNHLFNNIYKKAISIKLLLMKYNLVIQQQIITRCIELLKDIEIEENKILTNLI